MRSAVLTVCALSALLVACDGDGVRITTTSKPDPEGKKGVLKVIDTLQCPQTMGVLTRKGSAQEGGAVCTYVGPRGAEVTLHLIALDGEPVDDVLKSFEERLTRDMPSAAEAIANSRRQQARAEAEAARAEANAEQADAMAARADADAARAEASASQGKSVGDTAHVSLPGINIDAQGDKANVRIGPIHIRADDADADINITDEDGETVNIQASDAGAEIRTRESGGATRATWLLTDGRRSQDGWRSVGYQARGPEGGPIVLVTVRTKDRNRDRIFDAAEDLLTLNVGD